MKLKNRKKSANIVVKSYFVGTKPFEGMFEDVLFEMLVKMIDAA